MVLRADVRALRCPVCRKELHYKGLVTGERQRLEKGELVCSCGCKYEVVDGLPRLYREDRVKGRDRLLRRVYDGLPSVHDPLVRFSFPWAVGEREEQSRARYLARLELGKLNGAGNAEPLRILEVGAGTGSNVPLLRLGAPLGVEIWAVDLSAGMLRLLRERLRFLGDRETRVMMADAHALPFPDHHFDRVFHVGAINGYRDAAAALAEMARVARPGSPIVVVDERLDPDRSHDLAHRLFFKWMTVYDGDPHAPVEHLPPRTRHKVEQIGRFFYCMTFWTVSGAETSPSS
jgi:SAM-dependent methyltransferase